LSSQWKQFIELLGSSPSDLEFIKSLNLKKTQRTVIDNIEERPPIDWERFIPDGAIPKLISEFLTSKIGKYIFCLLFQITFLIHLNIIHLFNS